MIDYATNCHLDNIIKKLEKISARIGTTGFFVVITLISINFAISDISTTIQSNQKVIIKLLQQQRGYNHGKTNSHKHTRY